MRNWLLPERGIALVRDRETATFLGLSLFVGVVVGFGAAVLAFVAEGVAVAFEHLGEALGGSRLIPLLSVPLGVTIAWWMARRFAPEVAGDGVPEATAALAVRGGYLSTKSIPLKIVATALTLGGGGSAGREGPIVQVGSAIGSSISRRFGLGEDRIRSLVAAGAAAGIGASFNAPIAGMLFALEVILGSMALRHLSSVVLSSVAAAVTFRSLVPDEELLSASSYNLEDPRELVLYAGLAVLAVGIAYLFLRLLDLVETRAEHVRPAWLRPVGLAVMVGGIGVIEPRALGTGQEFVTELLLFQRFEEGTGVTTIAAGVLLALAVGKAIATALTLSTGGSGGAFMPSLFMGAALGAGYAKLIDPFWDRTGVSEVLPGAFAVVGMATVFAAVSRAPLTAILIVFEVTGANDYGLVLPLMLSAAFATFVADRLHPQSVYSMALARKGITVLGTGEVDLLDTVSVGEVMRPIEGSMAHPDDQVAEASATMIDNQTHGLLVIDERRRLVGVVTIGDVARAGGPDTGLSVADVMTTRPVTVGPQTPVSMALERMAVLGVGRLPVVADDEGHRPIGVFGRRDAIRAYHDALGRRTGRQLEQERLRQRTEPGAGYFDFRVPPGSVADGEPVRTIAWPEGSTLVSVRRGTDVVVPAGSTVLSSGDVVTAFGPESAKEAIIDLMNAEADEPTAEISLDEMVDSLGDTGEHSLE